MIKNLLLEKTILQKLKNPLNLFYDAKKILHVKTKMSGIESFSFDKKFPILLKKDGCFTELVVLNVHAAVFHSGVHSTLHSTNYFVVIIGLLKDGKLSSNY